MIIFAFAFLSIVCAFLAVLFSYREEQSKKKIQAQNKSISRHAYQLEILTTLQEKIGASMNIFDIADTIAMTAERALDVTTVSYAIIDQEKIHLHTYPRELVPDLYLEELNKQILDAMYTIDAHTKEIKIDETRSSMMQLSSNAMPQDTHPLSVITIPLVLNDEFIGMIAVSSSLPKAYSEDDTIMLNRIVNQSVLSLERMQSLLDIERVKTDSLVMNLSAGAILFLFQKEGIKLASVNRAALEFLDLPVSPTTDQVIDTMNAHISIVDLIRQSLFEKRELVRENIVINKKHFKFYIRPVTYAVTGKVIGISITMQDVTSETELDTLREQSVNIMVHELRAPLTSIKGAAALLNKGTLSDEDRQKMLHRISVSTERMLRDISNFLDAAKIQSGKFAVSLHEADLNSVIRDEIDLLSSLAEEKHVIISQDLDSRLGTFYFDPERLSQVLTNLLSNAIKFVHEGGEVTVSSKASGNSVEVTVSDNGVGIPEGEIPMLFSRYQQVQNTLQKGGTGLGLYISKQIVDAHHGRIWIESEEGKGTHIKFILPLLHHEKPAVEGAFEDNQEALLN